MVVCGMLFEAFLLVQSTRQIFFDRDYCICERSTCQEMRREERLDGYELQDKHKKIIGYASSTRCVPQQASKRPYNTFKLGIPIMLAESLSLQVGEKGDIQVSHVSRQDSSFTHNTIDC